jgi:cytosine/adenosine deaminase-related metal-dependent hydrolase
MTQSLAQTRVCGITTIRDAGGAHLGTPEAGKRADIAVVDGDALRFGALKQRMEHVRLDGVRQPI